MIVRRLLLTTIVAAPLMFSVLAAPALARPAAAGGPALKLISVSGYSLAIRGTGWPAKQRVVFALRQKPVVVGLELWTTPRGRFSVGVKHIDLCNGETMVARDLHGHRVVLSGPGLGCPPARKPPIPQLTLLHGRPAPPAVTHVDGMAHKPVTLRLGDAVYVWEQGTRKPLYVPSAPSAYLALMARGRTPPRACPEVECAAGAFWEWVGVRVGTTAITMNPSCRPGCELPSYLIPVKIKPRS